MYGLQELWFHHNGSASPLHESVESLPVEVVRVAQLFMRLLDATLHLKVNKGVLFCNSPIFFFSATSDWLFNVFLLTIKTYLLNRA